MKIALVPNWKRAWKFASVQLSVLGLLLMTLSDIVQSVWHQLPPQLQQDLPHAKTIAMIMFALSAVGRLLTIGSKEAPDEGPK